METRFMNCEALGDSIQRACLLPGGLTVPNLRAQGFRSLQNQIDADGFRALAPLPFNSQVQIDTAVVGVGLDRLTLMADVMAAGLTYNLPDPLSFTQLQWNKSNKVGNARRVMSPETRGENFLPDLLAQNLPIYLTISQFELGIRELKMSQRVGLPLDTSNVESGTRSVNENMEDAFINGATTLDGQAMAVAGYSAPGIVNATNAETQSLTAASWDSTPVAATILSETQAMMAKLRANKKFGPYRLYVNTEVGANLDNDYTTAAPQNTIKERLLKMEGLQAIRTADLMPATKVVLVQMTKDVLDVVVGQRPTVIPWTSVSGFTFYNMIMAIMVPRVKQDYNGKTGICVGTIA